LKSIEERILVALLDGDDDQASRLVSELLPNESTSLRAAAIKLERLTSGRYSAFDVKL